MGELRDGLIEAITEIESLYGFTSLTRNLLATDALDAVLDYLQAHANELADWNAGECASLDKECACVTDREVRGMLAVLRPVVEDSE